MQHVPDDINEVDLSAAENRTKAALLISRLFDLWQLDNNTRLNLLGMSETSRSVLSGYKQGTRPLPTSRDTLDRVGWLLAIHKALRLLYPRNPDMRYAWVSRRNDAFDNCAPIDVMQEQGLIGIARVARYLDHYRGL